MAVIELMEHITDPSKDQGEWIAKVDLVESGDKLLVEEQAELGDCGVECKTVQRAAEEIVGDSDTDLAEELWKVFLTLAEPLSPVSPPSVIVCLIQTWMMSLPVPLLSCGEA